MLAGGPFQGLVARQVLAAGARPTQAEKGEGGYGDLRPITRTDKATNDTLTLLLPEGFDGYVFEVPSMLDGEVDSVPLKEMGRMVHEAAAVDPRTGIVYLTEDRSNAWAVPLCPEAARPPRPWWATGDARGEPPATV